jgi:hypothetical protein
MEAARTPLGRARALMRYAPFLMNDALKKITFPSALGIGALVVVVAFFMMTRPPAPAAEIVAEEPSVAFSPALSRGSGRYPDGTYTAVGFYAPHGQPHDFQVTVTLQDDVIIAVESRLLTSNPISDNVVDGFQAGYKEFVVGKPITGLELGKVAGSSLTPLGFNDALRQIAEYAATL